MSTGIFFFETYENVKFFNLQNISLYIYMYICVFLFFFSGIMSDGFTLAKRAGHRCPFLTKKERSSETVFKFNIDHAFHVVFRFELKICVIELFVFPSSKDVS